MIMADIFSFPATMVWSLLAALALTGILVYFGIHVIGRQVIFVDLALAQIAALGGAVGLVMGYELEHSPLGVLAYSLAFTLMAAVVFSITKTKSKDIPHEAVIGITYAVAVAATIIVLAKSPVGPREFERVIKGHLLYVNKSQVMIAAAIYAAVGIFHFLFRRQFLTLSFGDEKHVRRRWLWDFLFYATLGFVVAISVAMAGVFLVFCLLVIPAVGALLFAKRAGVRLAIGWIGGAIVCILGIKVSYDAGWPTSSVIVVAFAVALIIAGVVRYILKSPSKWKALAHVGLFTVVFVLFGAGIYLFRHGGESPFEQALHLAHSKESTHKLTALGSFESFPQHKDEWLPVALGLLDDEDGHVRIRAMKLLVKLRVESALDDIADLLRDKDDAVRERCADLLHEFGDPRITPSLILAGDDEEEPDIKVLMYEVALHLGDRKAVNRLLAILEDEDFPGRRKEKAYMALATHVDFSFNMREVDRFREWWKTNRDKVVWKKMNGRSKFVLE